LQLINEYLLTLVDWDWSLDTPEAGGSWINSPVFDPVAGFGGNGAKFNGTGNPRSPEATNEAPKEGKTGSGSLFDIFGSLFGPNSMDMMRGTGGWCLLNGPFKDIKLHIGPFGQMKPGTKERCLTRNFNSAAGERATKDVMKRLLATKTFGEFRNSIELPDFRAKNGGGAFHNIGHSGIGGEVSNLLICSTLSADPNPDDGPLRLYQRSPVLFAPCWTGQAMGDVARAKHRKETFRCLWDSCENFCTTGKHTDT